MYQALFFLLYFCIVMPLFAQNNAPSRYEPTSTLPLETVEYTPVDVTPLPNSYFLDQTNLYIAENSYRRADVVYFVTIAFMMVLLQNLINLNNYLSEYLAQNYDSTSDRDYYGYTTVDWGFFVMALLAIAAATTYQDYMSVYERYDVPMHPIENYGTYRFHATMYFYRF